MIQKYEVSSWNEWDGASLKPAVDGDLALYADALKWAQEEVAVFTAQRDKATKDVEELIRERRALLDERETLTAENIRQAEKIERMKASLEDIRVLSVLSNVAD